MSMSESTSISSSAADAPVEMVTASGQLFGDAVAVREGRVHIVREKLNTMMQTLTYPADPMQEPAATEAEAAQVLYCFNTNPLAPYCAPDAGYGFSTVSDDAGIEGRPKDLETLEKFRQNCGAQPSDWAYHIEKYLSTVVRRESVRCFKKERLRTYYHYLRKTKNVFAFICLNMDRHLQDLYAKQAKAVTEEEKKGLEEQLAQIKASNAYKQAFALRAFFTELNFCYFYRHRLKDRMQLERIYKKSVFLAYGIYISYLDTQDEEIRQLLANCSPEQSALKTLIERLSNTSDSIYTLGYFNVHHFCTGEEDNVLSEMSYEYSAFVPFVRYTTLPKVFTMNTYSTDESVFAAYNVPPPPDFYALMASQEPLEKQPVLSRIFSLLRQGPKIMFDHTSRMEFKKSLATLESMRDDDHDA